MKEVLQVAGIVCGLCAVFLTLPGTIEMLLVTVGAILEGKRRTPPGSPTCRLAVVIPAHNEEALIVRCVASVADSAQRAGDCSIVVVADNCTDETAANATKAGARVLVRQNTTLRGKGYALRLAFDSLQEEGFDAFLVVDADSVVSSNLVGETSRTLAAGAAAVQCRYRVANANASIRTQLMELAFLAFNVLRPKGRSEWGLSAGILGNGFGLRSDTLKKIPWDADSIVEDLEYHLRLVTEGQRVDFIDQATVFGEMPAESAAARAQRSRWEGGRLRMAREWVPKLAAGVARGQWRLTEPLLELLMFPLAYHVLLLAFSLLVLPDPLRWYSVAALGLVGMHVISAALFGGKPLKTAMALAAAPFYILWKLTTLSGVLSASRRSASWVRTGRESEAGLRPAK